MKRPGYKTTEMWANVIVGIIAAVTQIPFQDKTVLAVLSVGYAIARGIAKNGVPDSLPSDFTVPVDTTDKPENR